MSKRAKRAKRPSTRRNRRPARKPARASGRSGRRKIAKRPAASAKRRAARSRKPARRRFDVTPIAAGKKPRLDRVRRTLEDTVPTPPSSLDMDRHGSAARTGRAELRESMEEHHNMTPLTGGDVDANWEQAYFTGDEAPGGDNPTPDQEVVDDIGKALGVEYQDTEELKSTDKVVERDKHRWELDPASAEDYKERK
jgi:hypothetical protein